MQDIFPEMAERRAAWTVAALAALAALAGVFTLPVLDRDEARFAQATAQMLESGDFVEIRYLDQPRHKKPVGIHWLQSASVSALSSAEARAIWAYRLPSVMGAALAALAVFLAGSTLLERRAAFVGAALFGTSLVLGVEGGVAKTDAVLVATLGLAFWTFVRARRAFDEGSARARLWALACWIAVAAGVLIKGPVAPAVVGLAVIALSVWERRIDWWRPFLHWSGPLAAAALLAPWLVAVQIATDGAFLREAFLGDIAPKLASGHETHGAPPGAHLAMLPILFFPAILFLPAGIAAAVSALREGGDAARNARLMIVFAAPIWIVFELTPTKLPHYVLPAYPALAVLAGWGFAAWGETRRLWRATGAALLLLGGAAAGLGTVALARWFDGPGFIAATAATLLIVAAIAAAAAGLRAHAGRAALLAVIAALTWHVGARGLVTPRAEALFLAPRAIAAVEREDLRPRDAEVWSTYTEPSLAFLLGGGVRLLDFGALAALSPDLDRPHMFVIDMSRWAENAESDRAAREAFFARLDAAACRRYAVEGFNYSRGDPAVLLIMMTGPCGETETS